MIRLFSLITVMMLSYFCPAQGAEMGPGTAGPGFRAEAASYWVTTAGNDTTGNGSAEDMDVLKSVHSFE